MNRKGIRAKVKRILSHEKLGDESAESRVGHAAHSKEEASGNHSCRNIAVFQSAERLLLWYRTPMGAKCFFSSCQLSKNWQRDCKLSGW